MSSAHAVEAAGRPAADGALAQELAAALRATLFESRLTVTPRRVAALAEETARLFEGFLAGQTGAETARAYGERLVEYGLSHTALLALLAALDGRGPQAARPGRTALGFCLPLVGGYMAAREADLLREQERTRRALERARLRTEE